MPIQVILQVLGSHFVYPIVSATILIMAFHFRRDFDVFRSLRLRVTATRCFSSGGCKKTQVPSFGAGLPDFVQMLLSGYRFTLPCVKMARIYMACNHGVKTCLGKIPIPVDFHASHKKFREEGPVPHRIPKNKQPGTSSPVTFSLCLTQFLSRAASWETEK